MLKNVDILEAVNVKIDYIMDGSSLAEHGYNLIDVNRYELCAQHTLPQTEWWPFTACMYSMQACLSYNSTEASGGNMTCSEAESGTDDDMEISGELSTSSSCECTVVGVATECASQTITSATIDDLTGCVHSDLGVKLADESKHIAVNANSGSAEWLKLDNMTITGSSDEHAEIESWAEGVFSATCNRIEYLGGTAPSSCDSVMSTSNRIDSALYSSV